MAMGSFYDACVYRAWRSSRPRSGAGCLRFSRCESEGSCAWAHRARWRRARRVLPSGLGGIGPSLGLRDKLLALNHGLFLPRPSLGFGAGRIQQLTELDEVIEWRMAELVHGPEAPATKELTSRIRGMWSGRLRGVQRNAEVWQSLLSVRALVLPMHEDRAPWIKFASLCRKSGRVRQAQKTLVQLLKYNPLAVTKPDEPGK